jgi:hypothetical protein
MTNPQDVVAQYLTIGGATVTVDSKRWRCAGCSSGFLHMGDLPGAKRQANDHSATCRAMPPQ